MAPCETIRQRGYRAKRHSHKTLAVILLILLLSILDAIFTLDLVALGAVELNPVMAYYLDDSPLVFFGIKYLLTCASIIIILLNKNVCLFGTKVQAKILFILFIISLTLVIQWQLYLKLVRFDM